VIRRIFRSARAEARKLVRRRLVWAAFALALVLGVAATAGWEAISHRAVGLESGRSGGPLNGFFVYAETLRNGLIAGAMLLVTLAGLFMAEEIELGTAKIVFSKPLRRSEVVLGKAIVLVALACGLLAAVAAASAAAGAAFGYGDIVDPQFPDYVFKTRAEMIGHAAKATALLLPPLVATLLVGFAVSALASQSGIAVGLTFAALVFSLVGGWLVRQLEPFLVTSYFGFPIEQLEMLATGKATRAWAERWAGNGPPIVPLGLAVSGVTALVSVAVAAGATALRPILGLLAAAGIGALAARPAEAAGHDVRFRMAELEVKGQVCEIDISDIDFDGRDDLLVFHTSGASGPKPERYLSIFYFRPATEDYPKTPDQTIEVPPEASVRFLADVDPLAIGREIGFMGPEGAFCFVAKNKRFSTEPRWLFRDAGFFDISSGWQLPDWGDLVKDVTGDGLVDVLFPRKGDTALWVKDRSSGRFVEAGAFPCDYKQTFGAGIESLLLGRFISFWATIAKPCFADVNGDKLEDLVAFRDRSLEVYPQRKEGERFPKTPDRVVPLRVIAEDAAVADDEFSQVRAAIRDLDRDGYADLVLYRNVGKITLFESMHTEVFLYRGGPNGWDEAKPTQIIKLTGVSISPVLIDIDGDGNVDLVVSSLRTDLITNAMRAIFQSVTTTYYVFRWKKDERKFGETADYSRNFTVDLKRIEGTGSIPFAYFWGDYDGDGVKDMLSLEDDDALTIFPGEATSGWWSGESLDFPSRAKTRIEVETSNSLEIYDLNRDGRHDVILWYWPKGTESGEERGTIRVLMSKK
jgi:ABC-type transport system involved in multi-copper enzyme maturation permease subunit